MNINLTNLYLTLKNADLHMKHKTVKSTDEYWWLIGDAGKQRGVLVMSKGAQNSDPLVITILDPLEAVRAFRMITRPIEDWRMIKISPLLRIALFAWHEKYPPRKGDDDAKVVLLPLERKTAYFVIETEKTADGYIPCLAVEGEKGFHRTDWRWDTPTFKGAQELCDDANERLGISPTEARIIQLSTMS